MADSTNTTISPNGTTQLDKRLRHLIEEVIELLLLACDEMDGNPDLEPDADGEPSLGWPERHDDLPPIKGQSYEERYGADDDREHDPAELGEPDEADFEPDVDVEPPAVSSALSSSFIKRSIALRDSGPRSTMSPFCTRWALPPIQRSLLSMSSAF